MITIKDKIKVFISSACGVGKENYNIARAGLKTIIESTGIAEVYLFEDEGAATRTAKQHYTEALEDCDICIFLIDNQDGVPPGVQVEVDCVSKYNIKSLYYFCDKDSREMTPLQRSLMGANFAKSKVVHSFEEVVKNGAQDLIFDLMNVYKKYCKGRLDDISPIEERIADTSILNSFVTTPLVVTKSTIADIDKCKAYFLAFIHDFDKEVKNSNVFDEWCYRFLPILFENKSITDFNLALYLKELEKQQLPEYHDVVKIRWGAIQAYFQDDLEEVVRLLEEALSVAKRNKIPEWIIKDILIDLRNQKIIFDEKNNQIRLDDWIQKEIEAGEQDVYYPLLDRFDSTLNELYIERSIKEEIKSPYTVSLGNDHSCYTDLLANIYVVAMFNGSLTHIVMMYKRLKLLAFHLCQIDSNWKLRILLVKSALMSYKSKELEGIINEGEDILGKVNASEAYEIFNFTNNEPIKYQRMIINLAALKSIGYFLDDKAFKEIIDEITMAIYQWLDEEKPCVALGGPIISTLSAIALRINQNLLATVCYRYLELGMNRWIDEVCTTIGHHIDLDRLAPDVKEGLLNQIILIVKDDKKRSATSKLPFLLIALHKKNKETTKELVKLIQTEMPIFYETRYKLETLENEIDDIYEVIRQYVNKIEERNISQGQGGRYSGYLDRPYLIIKSIMKNFAVKYDITLLKEIFQAASNTLLSSKQTIDAKCDAIELLVFLCNHYPCVMSNIDDTIEQLKINRKIVEDGIALLSNLSATVLKFISLFLYNCFGEEISLSVVELLPFFADDIRSQILISNSLLAFLEYENRDWLSVSTESILLQQALVWCKASQLEVRRNAIQILFQLLYNPINKQIIGNQLIKSMDNDNVYIKNTILQLLPKYENLDVAIRNYLLQKAQVDTNFVVRKVYNEVLLMTEKKANLVP